MSYSYIVGSAYLPVTGGLFLGDDATNALGQTAGRFWDSQDQRNTVRTRVRYEFTKRIWGGIGGSMGQGCPLNSQAMRRWRLHNMDKLSWTA